jgi:hypothetical protein
MIRLWSEKRTKWEFVVFSLGSRSIREFGTNLLQAADLQQSTFFLAEVPQPHYRGTELQVARVQSPVCDSKTLKAALLHFFVVCHLRGRCQVPLTGSLWVHVSPR